MILNQYLQKLGECILWHIYLYLCFQLLSHKKHLFLKLMYGVFNQKDFKYKLSRFPLSGHLERDLKLNLHEIYQKNIHMVVTDHNLIR